MIRRKFLAFLATPLSLLGIGRSKTATDSTVTNQIERYQNNQQRYLKEWPNVGYQDCTQSLCPAYFRSLKADNKTEDEIRKQLEKEFSYHHRRREQILNTLLDNFYPSK